MSSLTRQNKTQNGLPKTVGMPSSQPPHFSNPFARDLAWLILNPPLVMPGHYTYADKHHRHGTFPYTFSVPSSAWQTRAWQAIAPSLAGSQQNRLPSHEFLANHQRLGLYFEHLMKFWFAHSPWHELLQQGLPIREHGNKKQPTLGECDFLVFDKKRQEIQHWEVAVKFYLGLTSQNHNAQNHKQDQVVQWLGPNLKDQLDRKLTHTLKHQLPFSTRPVAREAILQTLLLDANRPTLSVAAHRALNQLAKTGTQENDTIRRVLWIKGALYDAPGSQAVCQGLPLPTTFPPLRLNPCRQVGQWNTTSLSRPIATSAISDFDCELPRLCWLGARNAAEVQASLMAKDMHLSSYRHPTPNKDRASVVNTAQHRACFLSDGKMKSRYFQVTDDWLVLAHKRIQQ